MTKLAKTDLPPIPRRPSLPRLPHLPVFTRGPKGLQRALLGRTVADSPGPVPSHLVATTDEWAVYWALMKLGKQPGIDFDFQSSMQGGRTEKGGMVLDFVINDPPNLAINVQGEYWHYGHGSEKRAKDRMQRAQAEALGIHVVYIDAKDAERAPIYYVSEALAGRDHSRMDE